MASVNLVKVLPAAYQGRVGKLFVVLDEEVWGTYEPQTGQIERHAQPRPGDEDRLNLAAIYMVLNRDRIYSNQRDDLPESKPLAATFRF